MVFPLHKRPRFLKVLASKDGITTDKMALLWMPNHQPSCETTEASDTPKTVSTARFNGCPIIINSFGTDVAKTSAKIMRINTIVKNTTANGTNAPIDSFNDAGTVS